MKKATATPAKDVDEYLASVPAQARTALETLRRTIKRAAPEAVERISYRIPVFYNRGMLVGFAAFKDHCSFFVMSPSVIDMYRKELESYDTSKGTIRFSPDRPLLTSLVKKLVKARVKENETRFEKIARRRSLK